MRGWVVVRVRVGLFDVKGCWWDANLTELDFIIRWRGVGRRFRGWGSGVAE